MVGDYAQGTGSLELRRPVWLFSGLAWLIAGPANPLSFYVFEIWKSDFDLLVWTISIAIPLSLGCAAAIFFLRGGGFGFVTLAFLTILVTMSLTALCGPIYTSALWLLAQAGIELMPVGTYLEALITSGTFVRLGLILSAIPILLSIVVLRVVAFQRERKKKKLVPTAGVV
jgi:hypothetical protein